jgi:signal transduction histidine kinase
MTGSLRKRLIAILLLLMLFAWISSAVLTVMASSRVLISQLDRQLSQYSDLVWYMTQVFASQGDEQLRRIYPWLGAPGDENQYPMVIPGSPEGELGPALNVWHQDKLVAALENSPHFEAPSKEGFYFQRDPSGEGGWRVLARRDEGSGLWLLVGIDLDKSRWAIYGVFGRAVFPLLIVLPLTVLILYFGVSRGLRPLQILANQISQRNPRLLEPIPQADVPAEIEPVVDSLNQLLRRLGEALESEQRFTANAAHELMTPLAAIKTEVQLCQRQVSDDDSRRMLERIVSRVDRATHTVQQLLVLARLDPEAEREMQRVDLHHVVVEALAETAHVAAERGITVDIAEGSPLYIEGNEASLAIMCRNLLSNAFRYACASSEVQVSLQRKPAAAVSLRICNDCAVITEEQFAHLQDRFYRVPGSDGVGAGLGLSIVARVVQLHRAAMQLGPWQDGRGFAVAVDFRSS